MAGLHEIIPGLAQAETDFRNLQIEGFLGVELPIAEIEVLPFTPRMFLELEYAGNQCDGVVRNPDPFHVEQFLWRVSAGFDRKASDVSVRGSPRRAVIATLAAHEYIQTVDEIHEYLFRAWSSMPVKFQRLGQRGAKGSRRPPKSAGTWVSSLIDAVASQYHWSEAQILDCPFRRLWQYSNRILERNIPEYAQPCPEALRLKDLWLQDANRKN